MSFWVYLLRCGDGSYYTGHTDDLERRIAQHEQGTLGGYTASRKPVKFVFSQAFETRLEALEAEFKIKSWSRKKKESLIKGDWQELKRLSRGKNRQDRGKPQC